MNTVINYMYRDANNYKYICKVIVKGELTYDQLKPYLSNVDGDGFCPEDVGLPHPGAKYASGFPGPADHCWCELDEDDVTPTKRAPTTLKGGAITAQQLLERFKKASEDDWPAQTKDVEEVYG